MWELCSSCVCALRELKMYQVVYDLCRGCARAVHVGELCTSCACAVQGLCTCGSCARAVRVQYKGCARVAAVHELCVCSTRAVCVALLQPKLGLPALSCNRVGHRRPQLTPCLLVSCPWSISTRPPRGSIRPCSQEPGASVCVWGGGGLSGRARVAW
jgi:hypothetical protein